MSDPRGALRIGVDLILRRGLGRGFGNRHCKNVAVNDRLCSRELLVEAHGLDQFVKAGKIAFMISGVLGLELSEVVDGLSRGGFVTRLYNGIPRDTSDADEEADDRDNDHQLDQVKSPFVTREFS